MNLVGWRMVTITKGLGKGMEMLSRDEFFQSLQRKAANLNGPSTAGTSREQSLIAHVRAELATKRQAPQCDLTAVQEYHRLLHRLALAVGLPH